MRDFGNVAHFFIERLRGMFEIVEIGDLRRLDQREGDALILLGREFLRRRQIEKAGQAEHADENQQRQRAKIQRAVQSALIGAAQTLENPIEEMREPAAVRRSDASAVANTSSAKASAR